MDITDHIKWLAQVNSGTCYPKEFDEIDTDLPYFKLHKVGVFYDLEMFNYSEHDNAARMSFVCEYLQNNIFPYVNGNLTGYFNIQLHDTYTYLNDGKDYTDVLTFGKDRRHKGPVMLPDCYFLENWNDRYTSFTDSYKWEEKIDKIIFSGSTTGSRIPSLNERIRLCLWGRNKPFCDFRITNVVQMDPSIVANETPGIISVINPYITLSDQCKYKYMLIIDGNTNKWTVDTFYTNSLSLMMPTKSMLWYYSLLVDKTHYVSCNYDNMEKIVEYYRCNPEEAKFIVKNGNRLAENLFNQDSCNCYLINLFEEIAANK